MSSEIAHGPAPAVQPIQAALPERLAWIGLRSLADGLDGFVAQATKQRWGPLEIIEQLAHQEAAEKTRRSLQARLKQARLGRFKTIADFDWNWPKKIDRELIEEILECEFIPQVRNIILIGTQGLGKTMIAKNVAHQAVHKGYTALFAPASRIIADIASQDSPSARERRFKHYARPSVLVIDEVGYLAYDNAAADILFQLVGLRYELKPIVMTTNLPFREWSAIFPNAASASALADRLTHHSHVLRIQGDSYRKHEAQRDRDKRDETK